MGRKIKTSPAEDLMDLVARLPWWIGVALAVVSHFGLHALAVQPIQVQTPVGGGVPLQAFWRGLAVAGQFIVPIVCLAGAALSAWSRHHRRALFDAAANGQVVQVVDAMTWQQFE